MSTPIEDGGPAFPIHSSDMFGGPITLKDGMSLRDWFAGQALPAVVADSLAFNLRMIESGKEPVLNEFDVAKQAYAYADAMLKARGGAA